MKKICKQLLLLTAFSALLAGCATDNTPKPTPLKQPAPDAVVVKQVWSHSMSAGADGHNLMIGSAIEGSTLIAAGFGGEITASDISTGQILWQDHLDHKISATPSASSNMVFVNTFDGKLMGIDLATGTVKWTTTLPSLALGAPSATDDVVVTLCHDSSVVAISTDSGKILWTYQATTPALTLYSNSSPVIANGVVYVGFDSGQLGAFDLYQGTEAWQIPIAVPSSTEAVKNMVDIDGTPVIDNGSLFVTSYHGTLSAVNMQNGQIIWQRKNSSFQTPLVQNSKVFVVDNTGRLQAFDESTGSTLWQQNDFRYRFISNPATINNMLVVGDYEGVVHFISMTDGTPLARFKVSDSGITSAPLVYNSEIIVTTDNGHVVALLPGTP